MAGNQKDPVLVVVQLSGGNDFMNTVVPYTAGIYYDSRPVVGLKEDEVLPIHDTLAWNPNCAPLQSLYEAGDIAVIQGIGYPNSNRSHFRAMDIWHTLRTDRDRHRRLGRAHGPRAGSRRPQRPHRRQRRPGPAPRHGRARRPRHLLRRPRHLRPAHRHRRTSPPHAGAGSLQRHVRPRSRRRLRHGLPLTDRPQRHPGH